MPFVMVDIEADGPIPGDFSMISFGAIVVETSLDRTFAAQLAPISERWVPEALAVSGFSREQTLAFADPRAEMQRFASWLGTLGGGQPGGARPVFVSDNNGFDWQFINWYFHHFTSKNPFGFSSQNLGSLFKGLVKNMRSSFKHLRKTKHTHDPLDDARGNAEAMLHMIETMGLQIR
jgi:hypothetical protein